MRVAILALLVSLGACHKNDEAAKNLTGGDPRRGEQLFRKAGCGTCHRVKNVPQAAGTVGPPLDGVATRAYLAGNLTNSPENLMHWVRTPHSVDPKTAMPETGLDETDARDIAAFLYTLR